MRDPYRVLHKLNQLLSSLLPDPDSILRKAGREHELNVERIRRSEAATTPEDFEELRIARRILGQQKEALRELPKQGKER